MTAYDDDLAELRARMAATKLSDTARFSERLASARQAETTGRFDAKALGAKTILAPGVEAWTVEDGRRDHLGEPIGGIVLRVEQGWDRRDPETGEISRRPTWFRTYDPMVRPLHRAFRMLTEDDIEPASIRPATTVNLVGAVRLFCREVGAAKGRTLDGHEADLVLDAGRLVAVLMGGR